MQIIKYSISTIILFVTIYSHTVHATRYTIESVPNPYHQTDVIYVVDPEKMLTTQDTNTINLRLKQLESQTTIETAIVMLPSIGNVDTREFANKLFNYWKIGKKEKDNGLLILFVLDQREVVFEVGYGLEGNLTDAKSYRLMEQYMLPAFRQNQFSDGMRIGADGVARYLEQQHSNGTLYDVAHNPQNFRLSAHSYIMFTIFILFTILCFTYDRVLLVRDWYFARYITIQKRIIDSLLIVICLYAVIGQLISFIAIFFFTEFAILSLIIWAVCFLVFMMILSNTKKSNDFVPLKDGEKVVCKNCRHRSVIEIHDIRLLLTPIEQYQLDIGSKCYRLFHCERNQCQANYKGEKINTGWKTCPTCQIISNKLVKTATLSEATENDKGKLVHYYRCVKCQLESETEVIIPSHAQVRARNKRRTSGGSVTGRGISIGRSSGRSGGGFRGGGRSGGGGSRGRF